MYVYLVETLGRWRYLHSYFILKLSTIQCEWQTIERGQVILQQTEMSTNISHDTCSNIQQIMCINNDRDPPQYFTTITSSNAIFIIFSFGEKLSIHSSIGASLIEKRTYSARILYNECITMVQQTRFKVIPITCMIMKFDDL